VARSVASRSSATYTWSTRRNRGSHAGCQPPVPYRPHAPVPFGPATRTDSVSEIPSQRVTDLCPTSPTLYGWRIGASRLKSTFRRQGMG
jgi:hypothetical protein